MSAEQRTMQTLITNARLVDPRSGRDERGVLALADGRIVAAGRSAPHDFTAERTIDAAGAASSTFARVSANRDTNTRACSSPSSLQRWPVA